MLKSSCNKAPAISSCIRSFLLPRKRRFHERQGRTKRHRRIERLVSWRVRESQEFAAAGETPLMNFASHVRYCTPPSAGKGRKLRHGVLASAAKHAVFFLKIASAPTLLAMTDPPSLHAIAFGGARRAVPLQRRAFFLPECERRSCSSKFIRPG